MHALTALRHPIPKPNLCRYPVLVLAGPAGAGKRELMHLLTHNEHATFVTCRSHTTRQSARDADVGGSFAAYHHISFAEFQDMVKAGEFLQTCRVKDELYGLSRREVDTAVQSGRIPVVCVEIEGAYILKKTSIRATYVYVRPDLSGLLGNSGNFTKVDGLHVAPARLSAYEAAHTAGFFDLTVELGKHDLLEQIDPVRQRLKGNLSKVHQQIPRQHPQWLNIEEVGVA